MADAARLLGQKAAVWSPPSSSWSPGAVAPCTDARKVWSDTSGAWRNTLKEYVSRQDISAIGAWAHDAKKLVERIRVAEESLSKLSRNDRQLLGAHQSLRQHASIALELFNFVVQHSRPIVARHPKHKVSTPFARPLRTVDGNTGSSEAGPIQGLTSLVIATFGW